ncbi:MAG TPA: hypothetical protein PLC38_02560 [Methanobacterium sp.]|jgi:hypothetical protein|nr:MAG: hypothetical protein FGO69_05480 [Methanobacterium sp.]HOI71149.1 hypothetical protein [Methanobacterium sp.]
MKPEVQGKLMVAMLVSVVAFGFGTGTVLITGTLPAMNSTNMFNTSQNSDLPVIYDTNQNNMDTTDSPGTQETPTPGTPTGGSSTGGSNQNNNPPSSNNTTN